MKTLIDPFQKISYHIDFLFGLGTSSALPLDIEIEYSRKTSKIKNFSSNGKLIGTFRTDGGIALTVYGSKLFIKHEKFLQNCVIPIDDVISFISEGRSLFAKHIIKCGQNVKAGSDVTVIDSKHDVIAVGRSLLSFSYFQNMGNEFDRSLLKGVGVRIREGIKSRST